MKPGISYTIPNQKTRSIRPYEKHLQSELMGSMSNETLCDSGPRDPPSKASLRLATGAANNRTSLHGRTDIILLAPPVWAWTRLGLLLNTFGEIEHLLLVRLEAIAQARDESLRPVALCLGIFASSLGERLADCEHDSDSPHSRGGSEFLGLACGDHVSRLVDCNREALGSARYTVQGLTQSMLPHTGYRPSHYGLVTQTFTYICICT